jgi:hypothetical protein
VEIDPRAVRSFVRSVVAGMEPVATAPPPGRAPVAGAPTTATAPPVITADGIACVD